MHLNEDEDQPEAAEEAAEAAETEDEDDAPSMEAAARKQGWVPRSEFRGDPADWTPADEYVRMGDPKYLRQALKDTRKAVQKLEKARQQDAAAFTERLNKFEELSKAQRSQLYKDIDRAKREAVRNADEEAYVAAEQAEVNLYEQEQAAGKTSAKPQEKADEPIGLDEITLKWVEDNEWFETDEQLHFAAIAINKRIAARNPSMSHEDQLEATKAEVMKKFPAKFGKKPGNGGGHTAVESGQRMAAVSKGKGFTDIPSEERRILERHIEEGLYKDKADAAKAYWS